MSLLGNHGNKSYDYRTIVTITSHVTMVIGHIMSSDSNYGNRLYDYSIIVTSHVTMVICHVISQ